MLQFCGFGNFAHFAEWLQLNKHDKLTVDDEIRAIIANPQSGVEKKGDLRGVFIHKFKIKSLQYLLAYRFTKTELELVMLGPHENYYRRLKKHLK